MEITNELRQALSAYQRKSGTPLGRERVAALVLLYKQNMGVPVLNVLVDYCIQKDHFDAPYLIKVGEDWLKRGLVTKTKAEDYIQTFSIEYVRVLKYLNVDRTCVTDHEKDLIDTWRDKYLMEEDLIKEACERAVVHNARAPVSYAHKLLTDWSQAGIRSMETLKLLEEKPVAKRGQKAKNNQFNNYSQSLSMSDIAEFERLLLLEVNSQKRA